MAAELVDTVSHTLRDLPGGARLVIVDDGCSPSLEASPASESWATDARVIILRHALRRGAGAARNTALRWCRENNIETTILLDGDCRPAAGFVNGHLARHRENPDAICIGGGIEGTGSGIWARLDRMMSWFTSIPSAGARDVSGTVHIPTTNMSLKLTRLHETDVFDERLRTGEDVVFIARLRKAGARICFVPEPRIAHRDRSDLKGFLAHQLQWGRHTYFVRFGRPEDGIGRRLLFAGLFVPCIPLYAVLATWLNMRAWLTAWPGDWPYLPIVWVTYLLKGCAIVDGALRPARALFKTS